MFLLEWGVPDGQTKRTMRRCEGVGNAHIVLLRLDRSRWVKEGEYTDMPSTRMRHRAGVVQPT